MADNSSRDQSQRLALRDGDVAKLVLEMTKPGEDEHKHRTKRYNHSYEVYRASAKRPRGLEPWQSKLRVPYGMQVLDTALVNINTGKPRIIVKPRNPDVVLNAKAMQVVMDYYVGEDHLVEKQPLFVQQGLILGVTIAKNHWLYKEAFKVKREWVPLPTTTQSRMVTRDGPTFEPWNVYDAWWDPAARDVESARYVVLRSWLSKDQLLQGECSMKGKHDRHECDGIYHNIDQLLKVGPSEMRSTTAQSAAIGGQHERYKDMFEVLETWTDDTVTLLGSRQVVLRNDANPYWHLQKPCVITQTRPDLFEMVGIPETELVDQIQEAQWTLQNMVIDNLHLTTMRGITYREGSVADPNSLNLTPRFKWGVTDHDDIHVVEIQPLGGDVFQERQRLLADMQLVTGINPYISGSDMSNVDQNTATGVTALQEVASRLLRFKASMIQYKGYQRSFEQWGDMIQQFMTQPVFTEIVGADGAKGWAEVHPQDIAGHFSYQIEGSEESLSRQQERGEAIALLNAFAPLAQLQMINFKPILERIAIAYDFQNPEELFLPPQTPPAAAPTQEQMDQQGGQDFNNVRGPQIGANPVRDRYMQQGGLQMDPQLAAALGRVQNS